MLTGQEILDRPGAAVGVRPRCGIGQPGFNPQARWAIPAAIITLGMGAQIADHGGELVAVEQVRLETRRAATSQKSAIAADRDAVRTDEIVESVQPKRRPRGHQGLPNSLAAAASRAAIGAR